jgi:DNA polymerase III subunit gamma/tau
VLGQQGAVKVLKARLLKKTALETSYIFAGGHGCGKTTLARILARALLCTALTNEGEPCNECDNCREILSETSDAFVEQDAASNGTIDNIREIVHKLSFLVYGAPKRVYLFDEAHRMSKDAQDVLLKPMEDKHLVCLLCTTEPEKIRNAIRSRCEEYAIGKITREDIFARMKWMLEQEKVTYEEDAVLTVIDHSGGHVRDVMNKLEMVAQLGPVTSEAVRDQLNLSVISTYYDVLLSLGDPAKSVALIEQACDRVGADEAASGLAEAAMNSYRLAHNMFADFVYVDRDRAKRLYETHGDGVTRLAEHFLGSRSTKIGLICDVLACASGVPVRQVEPPRVAPQVAVAALPTAPVPVQPVVVASGPAPAPVPPKPAQGTTTPPPASNGNMRPDGIGAPGTSDIYALTKNDPKAVPLEHPRGYDLRNQPIALAKNVSSEASSRAVDFGHLTADQWRVEFELLGLGQRPS